MSRRRLLDLRYSLRRRFGRRSEDDEGTAELPSTRSFLINEPVSANPFPQVLSKGKGSMQVPPPPRYECRLTNTSKSRFKGFLSLFLSSSKPFASRPRPSESPSGRLLPLPPPADGQRDLLGTKFSSFSTIPAFIWRREGNGDLAPAAWPGAREHSQLSTADPST